MTFYRSLCATHTDLFIFMYAVLSKGRTVKILQNVLAPGHVKLQIIRHLRKCHAFSQTVLVLTVHKLQGSIFEVEIEVMFFLLLNIP